MFTMLSRLFTVMTVTMILMAMPGPLALGQTPYQEGYVPIDPFRGDVSPMQSSLRKVEGGLGLRGQETNVFRRAGEDKLLYVERGVTAEYDRSQYYWFHHRRKGDILMQTVPPGTVFHLGLPPPAEAPVEQPDSPYLVDGRLSLAVSGTPGEQGQHPVATAPTAWQAFNRVRTAHHQAVVMAIDRVMPTGP
jgi:hypothetical protein